VALCTYSLTEKGSVEGGEFESDTMLFSRLPALPLLVLNVYINVFIMADLPYDIWMCFASFISREGLWALRSVNWILFNIALIITGLF